MPYSQALYILCRQEYANASVQQHPNHLAPSEVGSPSARCFVALAALHSIASALRAFSAQVWGRQSLS